MASEDGSDHKKVVEAARVIEDLRSSSATIPVVLTGRIVNGRVEIDKNVLDEIAKKHPNANGSFIAVNAPFDPDSASAN
jgi:hypothetical protein